VLGEPGVFNVSVDVVPSQPIKGVEINMTFNPSQLQVVSVSEGDLFEGYPTFFVVHEINNDEGFIVAYGLVVGQGNTLNEGSFISIVFNATAPGVSSVHLKYVGVVNETQYVAVTKEGASLYVVYPWDVPPYRVINYIDLSSLVSQYGQPGVDYLDLSVLVSNYGRTL
jgi:hypothetical protein